VCCRSDGCCRCRGRRHRCRPWPLESTLSTLVYCPAWCVRASAAAAALRGDGALRTPLHFVPHCLLAWGTSACATPSRGLRQPPWMHPTSRCFALLCLFPLSCSLSSLTVVLSALLSEAVHAGAVHAKSNRKACANRCIKHVSYYYHTMHTTLCTCPTTTTLCCTTNVLSIQGIATGN
jgi:hypothetical protein